ncbi:hypothetical protein EBS80_05095 [bacterium]|nr:hypothetical protein [bacterium]
MLRGSGVEESANVSSVICGWLADAERRGTNDPKQKADPNFARPWREGTEPNGTSGELRAILRSRILGEQVVRSVFDGQVLEWVEALSEPARALLNDAFILHELLRGPGVATLRVKHGEIDAVSPLIAEIASTWSGGVSIETADPPDGQPFSFIFRLR